ncbi:hypothetical protein QOZ80_6BG0458300 [Eleusine coracana subsp. coracana]|nr:hypothetical protein QOZ80_6BG0458300 [Eleusine coracana subsp. coracana]
MGRSPSSCDQQEAAGLKRGPWTPEEDKLLIDYIQKNGQGKWHHLSKLAGLNRCGKSCRLRWSLIARKLPGRTDNKIKNHWNTHLRKKLLDMGIDPVTHRPRTDLNLLAGLPNLLAGAAANLGGNINLAAAVNTTNWDMNALKLQADVAKFQLLHGLVNAITAAAPSGGVSTVVSVDQQGGLVNMPRALTTVPAVSPATTSFTGLMHNGFGDGIADGLSSTELGHSRPSGSNVTAAMAPPLIAAEECNNAGGGSGEETPASNPFEELDNLNLQDDLSNDDTWADLLE